MKLEWKCVNCTPAAAAADRRLRAMIDKQMALLNQDKIAVHVHLAADPRRKVLLCMKCMCLAPHYRIDTDLLAGVPVAPASKTLETWRKL